MKTSTRLAIVLTALILASVEAAAQGSSQSGKDKTTDSAGKAVSTAAKTTGTAVSGAAKTTAAATADASKTAGKATADASKRPAAT